MISPLVSVVIPLYNAEEFIEQCVMSIIAQSYHNIEIIIINDGSTDNSYTAAKNLKKKYPHITLVSQKNGGPSKSRNHGLDLAQGSYISFVDSDDFLDPDTIKKALFASLKHDAEATLFNMANYTPDGIKGLYWDENIFFQPLEIINPLTDERCMAFTNAAPSLIKLPFLKEHKIRFKENLIYEDWAFMAEIYKHSNQICLLSEALYYYRHDFGRTTITSSASIQCLDIFKSYQFSCETLKDHCLLHFRNDLKILTEAINLYIDKIQHQKSIKLNIHFLAEFNRVIQAFPKVYFLSLCSALKHLDRRKLKYCLRLMVPLKLMHLIK